MHTLELPAIMISQVCCDWQKNAVSAFGCQQCNLCVGVLASIVIYRNMWDDALYIALGAHGSGFEQRLAEENAPGHTSTLIGVF